MALEAEDYDEAKRLKGEAEAIEAARHQAQVLQLARNAKAAKEADAAAAKAKAANDELRERHAHAARNEAANAKATKAAAIAKAKAVRQLDELQRQAAAIHNAKLAALATEDYDQAKRLKGEAEAVRTQIEACLTAGAALYLHRCQSLGRYLVAVNEE